MLDYLLHARPHRNFLFLQRLLADGAPLDEVWPKTGETPLLMAINYRDVEVGAV
jgi:hypothetical protein